MTEDVISWRAHVVEQIKKAAAHQDLDFYRITLPQWEAELIKVDAELAEVEEETEP